MKTLPTLLISACWSVVLLSLVRADAGADYNRAHLNGLALHDVRQRAVGTSDGLSASPPPTETPAATPPSQIALADPQLASTGEKRQQLTYLVRCALPEDIVVYTQHGPDRFTFQGRLGLAPRWLYEAMTPSEERWVSACLLAHVNYFGKSVPISLRAAPPVVPALASSDDEQHTFSIFEGGFFGNLFLPAPVAYTCRGDRTLAQARDPILQDRVCTHETGVTTAEGTPITLCHFLVTGRCEDAASFTVDGTHYTEVTFTYLRPSMPSAAETP